MRELDSSRPSGVGFWRQESLSLSRIQAEPYLRCSGSDLGKRFAWDAGTLYTDSAVPAFLGHGRMYHDLRIAQEMGLTKQAGGLCSPL